MRERDKFLTAMDKRADAKGGRLHEYRRLNSVHSRDEAGEIRALLTRNIKWGTPIMVGGEPDGD